MTFERFKDYATQNYTPLPHATLRFTEENLRRAFRVYVAGASYCTTKRAAVLKAEGRVLRRLENFLIDINVGLQRLWVYDLRVVKVNCVYTNQAELKGVEADVELVLPALLDGLITEKIDERRIIAYVKLHLEELFNEGLVRAFECKLEPREDYVGTQFERCWNRIPVEMNVASYTYRGDPLRPRYAYDYSLSPDYPRFLWEYMEAVRREVLGTV